MAFIMNYREFEIYKNNNGDYSIMIDTPDGLIPCMERTDSLEKAIQTIDNV